MVVSSGGHGSTDFNFLAVYRFSVIEANFSVSGLPVIEANFLVSCAHHWWLGPSPPPFGLPVEISKHPCQYV